jgi:hypothetical protein
MNAITALIERMSQAPHEFVEEGKWVRTRWAHITDIMIAESRATPRVFTQEEVDAYMTKLCSIVRAQLEEQICIEILNPLRPDRGEQMELFPAQSAYPPGAIAGGNPVTMAGITKEALKILEEEMFKAKLTPEDIRDQRKYP